MKDGMDYVKQNPLAFASGNPIPMLAAQYASKPGINTGLQVGKDLKQGINPFVKLGVQAKNFFGR
jgi:hypothetical protein